MNDELKNLFIKFKNRHFTAVQMDTELGHLDYDDAKWFILEKKAKTAWEESDKTEKIFLNEMINEINRYWRPDV